MLYISDLEKNHNFLFHYMVFVPFTISKCWGKIQLNIKYGRKGSNNLLGVAIWLSGQERRVKSISLSPRTGSAQAKPNFWTHDPIQGTQHSGKCNPVPLLNPHAPIFCPIMAVSLLESSCPSRVLSKSLGIKISSVNLVSLFDLSWIKRQYKEKMHSQRVSSFLKLFQKIPFIYYTKLP